MTPNQYEKLYNFLSVEFLIFENVIQRLACELVKLIVALKITLLKVVGIN